MTVKLLRDSRIKHKAGEIVTVSPAEAHFLVSTGSAVEIAVSIPKAVTPETAEVPEEAPAKPAKRTIRKK